MNISLLYFDDCPNWQVADERLAAVTKGLPNVVVRRHLVAAVEEAEGLGFHGSPSILVDGVDVFSQPGDPVGLACRIYRTPDGWAGAPTIEQLRAALGLPDVSHR